MRADSNTFVATRTASARVAFLSKLFALVLCLLQLPLPLLAATNPSDFNLASTAKTVRAGELPNGSVQIAAGSHTMTVTSGMALTPAQLVAVNQILANGNQVIQLNGQGAATGGRLNIATDFGQTVRNLSIPTGVTGLAAFNSGANLAVVGDIKNYGNVYAYTTQDQLLGGTISAANIVNNAHGVISSALSSTLAQSLGAIASPFNLSLVATNRVENYGSIASSGALSIVAGSSILNQGGTLTGTGSVQAVGALAMQAPSITNTGNVLSQLADISVATQNLVNSGVMNAHNNMTLQSLTANTLSILNQNGKLIAGLDLNIQAPLQSNYAPGTAQPGDGVRIDGGLLAASKIDIKAAGGTINVHVDELDGPIYMSGAEAFASSQRGDLRLADIQLTGDPVFTLSGTGTLYLPSFDGFDNFYAYSEGNIASNPGTVIRTHGGHVRLIAGANLANLGSDPMPVGPGSINLQSTLIDTTAASGNAGNITIRGSATTFSVDGTLIANGAVTGNGGTIEVTTSALDVSGANVTMQADGAGSGSRGGSVLVSTGSFAAAGGHLALNSTGTKGGGTVNMGVSGATSDLMVTNLNGGVSINARGLGDGTSTLISGGSVVLSAGRSLTLDPSAMMINGTGSVNTDAGTCNLSAGSGTLRVTGSILSSGTGTGNAGQIVVTGGQAGLMVDGSLISDASGVGDNTFFSQPKPVKVNFRGEAGTLTTGAAAGSNYVSGTISSSNLTGPRANGGSVIFTGTGSTTSMDVANYGLIRASGSSPALSGSITFTGGTRNININNAVSGEFQGRIIANGSSVNLVSLSTTGTVNLNQINGYPGTVNITTSGPTTVSGPITSGGGTGTVSFTNLGGALSFLGTVDTQSGGTININNQSGTVTQPTQTSALICGTLNITSTGNTISLTGDNSIGNLSLVSAGNIVLNNKKTINDTKNLVITQGDLGGSLTLTSTAKVFISAPVTASSITITAPTINVNNLVKALTGNIALQGNGVVSGDNFRLSMSFQNALGCLESVQGNVTFNQANAGGISLTSLGTGFGIVSAASPDKQIILNGGNQSVSFQVSRADGILAGNGRDIGITVKDGPTVVQSLVSTAGTAGISMYVQSLENRGLISATGPIRIYAVSPGLLMNGSGTYIAGGGMWVYALPGGSIMFDGNLTLSSATALQANSGSVQVNSGATVTVKESINILTSNLINPNGFVLNDGATLRYNNLGRTLGTIVNADGDVILTTSMLINPAGKSLAIIAAGDVMASGVSSINLSNSLGSGGHLTIMAGVTINPDTDGMVQNTDPEKLYTVSTPSATGGSIILPGVKISTASTAPASAGAFNIDAGHVLMIANAGSESAGIISTGAVDTSSKYGAGGRVTMIGQGGVMVNGPIVTSGAIGSGSVNLVAAKPVASGLVQIDAGYLTVLGQYSGQPMLGSGAGVTTGTITTRSASGAGGAITLAADSHIRTAALTTSGYSSSGAIALSSLDGSVTVSGNLAANGLDRTTLPTGSGPSMTGAAGGAISISAPQLITIKGNIVTAGGAVIGSANGGHAGDVSLVTTSPLHIGNLAVKGYINARGGNAAIGTSGGTGGDAGTVTLDAGAMQIAGGLSLSDGPASVVTTGGKGATNGAHGQITIRTYATQRIPENFDLTSAIASVFAIPGGLFTIGAPQLVNGANYRLVSGTNILDKTTVFPGAKCCGFSQSTTVSTGSNLVSVTTFGGDGTTNSLEPVNSLGQRIKLTPANAVYFYQLSAGQTPTITLDGSGRAAAGSSLTLPQVMLPTSFLSFVLAPAGSAAGTFSLDIAGSHPVINLASAKAVGLDGSTLTFNTAGVSALFDYGSKGVVTPATTTIDVPTGKLILAGGGSFNLAADMNAQSIYLIGSAMKPLSSLTIIDKRPMNSVHAPLSLAAQALPASVTATRSDPRTLSIGSSPLYLPTGAGSAAVALMPALSNNASIKVALNSQGPAQLGGTFHTTKSIQVTSTGLLYMETDSDLVTGGNISISAKGVDKIGYTPASRYTASGTITMVGKQGLILGDRDRFDAGKGLTIDGGTGALSGNTVQLTTQGGLLKLAAGTEVSLSGHLQAGTVIAGTNLYTLASPVDTSIFSAKGGIVITGAKISLGSATALWGFGSGVKLVAGTGGIVFGAPGYAPNSTTQIVAAGSNIGIYTLGDITGTTALTELAINASGLIGQSPAKAGNVEIAAGTNQSMLQTALALPPGYTTSIPLGQTQIENNGGIIAAYTSGAGTIDVQTLASELHADHGAIVFNANNKSINLSISNITSKGLIPIGFVQHLAAVDPLPSQADTDEHKQPAYAASSAALAYALVEDSKFLHVLSDGGKLAPATASPAHQIAAGAALVTTEIGQGELFLHPLTNLVIKTEMGTIILKKGAVVALNNESEYLSVTNCGSLGDVSVNVSGTGKKLKVVPGEELTVSRRQITVEALKLSDGTGRRRFTCYTLSPAVHIGQCDASIGSILMSKRYLARLLKPSTAVEADIARKVMKSAAAIEVVTRQRGAYTATAEAPDRVADTDSSFTPVGFASSLLRSPAGSDLKDDSP